MKGVILGVARDAGRDIRLVDVTHEIARHDTTEAALALEAAVPCFPDGTVHLVVVDPGVGTERRGLVLAANRQGFVGPDNGVFTPLLHGDWRAYELAAPSLRRPVVSRTFHGRDVFAPAAAYLATGVGADAFGPRVDDPVRLPWRDVREGHDAAAGVVIHVDRFGNLITSIRAEAVEAMGASAIVRVGRRALTLVGTYGDLPTGDVGALIGSGGRLEIAVREGSAAALLRARRGTPVVLTRTAKLTSMRERRRS